MPLYAVAGLYIHFSYKALVRSARTRGVSSTPVGRALGESTSGPAGLAADTVSRSPGVRMVPR